MVVLFLLFLLVACGNNTEDTEDYIGVISSESSMGYEYTVTKEIDSFQWEVGYKDDQWTIEENDQNAKLLDMFRMYVGESRVELVQLVFYIVFLIVALSLAVSVIRNKSKAFRPYHAFLLMVAIALISFVLYHVVQDFQNTLNSLENVLAAIKDQL